VLTIVSTDVYRREVFDQLEMFAQHGGILFHGLEKVDVRGRASILPWSRYG
jgi:hypothetical protein